MIWTNDVEKMLVRVKYLRFLKSTKKKKKSKKRQFIIFSIFSKVCIDQWTANVWIVDIVIDRKITRTIEIKWLLSNSFEILKSHNKKSHFNEQIDLTKKSSIKKINKTKKIDANERL